MKHVHPNRFLIAQSWCWLFLGCNGSDTTVAPPSTTSSAEIETRHHPDTRSEEAAPPQEPNAEEVVLPNFAQLRPESIPTEIRERMVGLSYQEGCPLDIDSLRLLRLPHWGIDGEIHTGELIVEASEAENIIGVFAEIFEARFPIQRMRLVHEYDGDDNRSMADNNTSAFNCRQSAGSDAWSQHSYGTAIDINPLINPYVTSSGTVMPPGGREFLDRTQPVPGIVTDGGAVVRAFERIGWSWGGHWTNSKDYQHFSRSGR